MPWHAPHTAAPDRRPSQNTSVVKHKDKPITKTPAKPFPTATRTTGSQETEARDIPTAIYDGFASIAETTTREPAKSESFSTHPGTSNVFEINKITVTNAAYSVGDASATRVSTRDDEFLLKHLSASYFTVSTDTLSRPTRAASGQDSSSEISSTAAFIDIGDIPRIALTVAATVLPVQKEVPTVTETFEVVQDVPAFLLLDSLGSAIATIEGIGPDLASYLLASATSLEITVSTVTHPVSTLASSTVATTMDVATDFCTLSTSKTMTTAPSQPTETTDVKVSVYVITQWQYFVGMFLPTLLSTSISIPIGILERSVKLFHPFHALARPGGARAAESLLVEPGSGGQMISALRRPFRDSFVLILVTALALAAVFLTPFSSEAIRIQLHGCEEGTRTAGSCAITLGVSLFPSLATLALLMFMLLMLLLIAILLKSWKTGVASNPWSMCGIASLATNPGLLRMLSESATDGKVLRQKLESQGFRIHRWENERGLQYGICLNEDEAGKHPDSLLSSSAQEAKPGEAQWHKPPMTMRYWVRGLFVAFSCGILALIVYYESGTWVNSFEDFMDSESFGVHFLFTSIGVVVNIFWKALFEGVAILSPFQMLARGAVDAHHSILLTPPLDAFTGLWAGIRRKDCFLAAVAWCTVLSQFLPILLANVPAATVQTRTTNLVCSWMAVAVLGSMILVLAGSFFVRWPRMPADPTTIIGMMCYVADSPFVERFEGLSMLEEKERDRKVQIMQSKYALGEIRGVSGKQRIAVYTVNDETRSPESV
ncbi:hypothetical protein F4818DRAFT_442227 [Hypoxylon cercidicola]|nr:hypothetical protein F4818DRAFT_442227 [Hypoxylon cercidicola]